MTKYTYLKLMLLFSSIAALGYAAPPFIYPSHPIVVRVAVRDPDGIPIEGAAVKLALPRYGRNQPDQRDVRFSDGEGIATVNGTAEQDYAIFVEKSGYYPSAGPHRDLTSANSIQQFAVGTQELHIELRPIRNPVAGILLKLDGLKIPELNKPFGFDLVIGDWVTPHGSGRSADLSLELDGYYKTPDDYSFKLSAIFAKDGDGVQPVSVAAEPNHGSAFQLPYEAPIGGYAKTHLWERTHVNKERVMTDEWRGGTVFIFRARTELDANGNVIRGLYGHLDGNVDFRGTPEKGYKLSFNYWLNPEWTRSLESDPTKTATSVKP